MHEVKRLLETQPNCAKLNLEYLNIRDLTLLLPKLNQFKNLQQLILQKNLIKSIPNCASLKQLKILDISNNPIKVDSNLLDSLFSIPKLQCLNIDLKYGQRQIMIQNLPNLKYINGQQIIRNVQNEPTTQLQLNLIIKTIQQEKLRAKSLFNRIYTCLDQNAVIPQQNDDFQFQYKEILYQFQYFYANINNKLAKDCILIYSKNKMLEAVDNNLTTFLQQNGYQRVAQVIQTANKYKKQHFQDILKMVLGNAYSQDFSNQVSKIGNKLRKQTLYHNQITRLKQKINDLSQQNQQIARVNQKYLKMAYQQAKKQNSPIKNRKKRYSNFSDEKENFNLSLTKNKKETLNKSQSKKQIKRKQSQSILNTHNDFNLNPKNKVRGNSKSIDKSYSYRVLPQQQQNMQVNFLVDLDDQNKLKMVKKNSLRNIKKLEESRISKQLKDNLNCTKKITVDQLIQLIEEFMGQKAKYNLKCVSKKQIFQTAQQFLFTFFMRKYGLKDIALDWSLLIIKSLQTYSKQMTVKIFAKILQNQLQQSFYQQSLQFSIFTHKIIQQLYGKVQKTQYFNLNQIQEIFFTIFPEEDLKQFQSWIQDCQMQNQQNEKKKYKVRQVLYRIQQHYYQNHKKDIQYYVKVFRRYDSNQDGVLENEQIDLCLKSLLQNLQQQQEKKSMIWRKLVKKIKNRTGKGILTFSELIDLIRSEKLKIVKG